MFFLGAGYKILSKTFYEEKSKDPEEERMHIVLATADIIREEFKQHMDMTEYITAEMAFQDSLSVVPKTLSTLIDAIISKRMKGYRKALDCKAASLTHAIMSAARPRSFLSMIQIGLVVHMQCTFRSANAVNVLHNLSFAASYKECKKYEVSAMMTAQPEVIYSFHQWIFNNADIDIGTLDGFGMWYGMGGALAVTPATAVNPASVTIRLKTIPTND